MEIPGKEFYNRLDIDSVLSAVEDAGFPVSGHCLALNSLENRVYDVGLEEGGHLIVKFYRPARWNLEQILEEHSFLAELSEAEIPVIAPIRLKEGTTIRETKGIYYTLWPAQRGRLVEELDEESLTVLGRLVARIHNVGAAAPAKHRITLTVRNFGEEPLRFLIEKDFLPSSLRNRYETAAGKVFQCFHENAKNVPFHRIHGDCHKGNLIRTDDGFCFIDFDDFVTGPAIQDLWMLLPFGDSKADYERGIFLSGYREFRHFSDSWFHLVEPLRGLRYIHYSAWIAKRWEDPSFPNAFPHFGSDEYWERETTDLERLTSGLVRDERLSEEVPSVAEAQELTNKDFFWDLE
ncbi:phosphotransferase enzyme family protein [Leptospira broomii serovar Hurstbridge str. 5399]|uniref:Stress response kinase A n=1 Tax=Leptospira broomii serovar Hurstbridge str. 5399 TaxID=1049789 RepID=T0FGN3_9LEPT|nr:serine/threonine protein kinase [Leptospira broomii]EQA46782.1 phosphotransferase enzyme family protein [Leptospira broomii serovar Hurstbridge str. 5399]